MSQLQKNNPKKGFKNEYFMFMFGWNSTGGGDVPFLIPTNIIKEEEHICCFMDRCNHDEINDCHFYQIVNQYKTNIIPSELGKTQIIKKMFFSFEQNSGGQIIEEDGKNKNIF